MRKKKTHFKEILNEIRDNWDKYKSYPICFGNIISSTPSYKEYDEKANILKKVYNWNTGKLQIIIRTSDIYVEIIFYNQNNINSFFAYHYVIDDKGKDRILSSVSKTQEYGKYYINYMTEHSEIKIKEYNFNIEDFINNIDKFNLYDYKNKFLNKIKN